MCLLKLEIALANPTSKDETIQRHTGYDNYCVGQAENTRKQIDLHVMYSNMFSINPLTAGVAYIRVFTFY